MEDPPQSSIHALNTTTQGDLTQRTSTYERSFTREGNYLVNVFKQTRPVSILIFFSCFFSEDTYIWL